MRQTLSLDQFHGNLEQALTERVIDKAPTFIRRSLRFHFVATIFGLFPNITLSLMAKPCAKIGGLLIDKLAYAGYIVPLADPT